MSSPETCIRTAALWFGCHMYSQAVIVNRPTSSAHLSSVLLMRSAIVFINQCYCFYQSVPLFLSTPISSPACNATCFTSYTFFSPNSFIAVHSLSVSNLQDAFMGSCTLRPLAHFVAMAETGLEF